MMGGAALRHVVAPLDAQAVATGDNQDDQAAHDEFGDDGEDVEGNGEMQHEQQGEHRLQTPAKHAQHQHAEQADDDEKERVDDVVRGNHLRFVAAFGAMLDDGIKRHGVDAAAKGDGEEGERGADKTRVVPEGGECLRLGNGGVGADGDDARKSGGEDKGADGHQPRFYPPARQQVAEERADADADGKQHQQVGGDFRATVQHFFGVLRDCVKSAPPSSQNQEMARMHW